jgi:DNA invertase Pin-like site-specific DNA recombinase
MAVAEFERAIIQERVNAGIAAARNRGVRLGRPTTLSKRRDEVMGVGVGMEGQNTAMTKT